jgi:hypothetical protein
MKPILFYPTFWHGFYLKRFTFESRFMKRIYYLLLISVICGSHPAVMAQIQPATPPKVYTSKPASSSLPRVSKQQDAPVAFPKQQNKSFNGSNPRVTTSPSKDSMPTASVIRHPDDPVGGGLLSLGLAIGLPQGAFKTATNGDVGLGVDVSILANLAGGKRSPSEWAQRPLNMYVGGNFQYMRQNGVTDRHTEQNSFSSTAIESKVVNNMYALNAVARLELLPGLVKLFAEVSAGGRLLNGVHKLHVEDNPIFSTNPNDKRILDYSNSLSSSIVGNLGFGGGMRVGSEMIKVELKVMYIKGSSAEYVDMKSVTFNRTENSISYSNLHSVTDMIIPQLSVSIGF